MGTDKPHLLLVRKTDFLMRIIRHKEDADTDWDIIENIRYVFQLFVPSSRITGNLLQIIHINDTTGDTDLQLKNQTGYISHLRS